MNNSNAAYGHYGGTGRAISIALRDEKLMCIYLFSKHENAHWVFIYATKLSELI